MKEKNDLIFDDYIPDKVLDKIKMTIGISLYWDFDWNRW